jgi:hypothetical protein
MRVRTAVAIVTAFVAVKAALTAVTLIGWISIPGRNWPLPTPWHIALGDLGGWLAAGGAASAAVAALYIATGDRRERHRERAAAELAQANLVLVKVVEAQGWHGFGVEVVNYGTRAILDIEFDTAHFETFPKSRPTMNNETKRHVHVLDSDRSPHTFWVTFVDDAEQVVITGAKDSHGNWVSDNADPSKVSATIRFRDANGNRWSRSNSGSASRIQG